jgi:hypothetical protein
LCNSVRTEQCHLGGDFGHTLSVAEFFQWQVAQELEPLDGAAPGDDRRTGFFEVLFGAFERVLIQRFSSRGRCFVARQSR